MAEPVTVRVLPVMTWSQAFTSLVSCEKATQLLVLTLVSVPWCQWLVLWASVF
jgi:hypothetical protein